MQYAYLKVFDVVSDVPDDRYAHYEDLELDVFDLIGQFFFGSALEDFIYCDLSLLLFGHLAALALQLTLYLSSLHAICHLLGDLLVTVVDDFNEEIPAFVDGCPVEHECLEYVADDRLVVNGEIQLKRIWWLAKAPDLRQDFFLPSGSHDEIIDDSLELFLSDALLKDVLIVFHECVDVKLHVETLQALILLVPDRIGVV